MSFISSMRRSQFHDASGPKNHVPFAIPERHVRHVEQARCSRLVRTFGKSRQTRSERNPQAMAPAASGLARESRGQDEREEETRADSKKSRGRDFLFAYPASLCFFALCPPCLWDSRRGVHTMGFNAPLNRKLRMGLIGGGQGAFIGKVHSIAAIMDNRAQLVAGALSSDPAKAKASAPDYDIKAERAYASYQEMVAAEAKLAAAERIDFVSIATPNHVHFEIAKTFAEAGFNIVCDKPMTFDLGQAEELARIVQDRKSTRLNS